MGARIKMPPTQVDTISSGRNDKFRELGTKVQWYVDINEVAVVTYKW